MMSREKQINLIRDRLNVPMELDYPTQEMMDILNKDIITEIENAIIAAENEALEWVLREVFEVTP